MLILEPNVHSLSDGFWLGWSTMSLVGFGDIVPNSTIGRLLSILLLIAGIVLWALLSATVSAMLIGKGVQQVENDVSQLEREESMILSELKRLHERLDQLEQRINSNIKTKL